MQCPLCPNEDRLHPEAPVFEGEVPMATLACGHQVHTHCLINEFVNNYARTRCGACEQRIVEERVQDFYDGGNGRPRQSIADLWANSEEFRNDIRDLKKRQLAHNKLRKEFKAAASVIRTRFLENIRTSMEVIRDQKEVAKRDYRRIPCKRAYNTLGRSSIRKLNQVRGTYGIGPWELRRELADIPGAPKFSDIHYYRWKETPQYFFRIRL